MELNTPLTVNDLDFRVHQVTNSGYAIILPYKSARVDMLRLDTVVGRDYWQRKHEVINDNLFCYIGVYNKEIKEWIWKSDVGTESFTEKEKGQASDAFKRAGFNWGIGRELYEYPTIIVQLNPDEITEKNGKKTASSKFKPNDWNWELQSGEDGIPTLLIAKDKTGNVRFSYNKNNSSNTQSVKQEQPKQKAKSEPKEDKPKVEKWMTEKQFEELKQKTKAEIKKYLGIYNGTTPHTDGHIYGMKKQYKEELEKLV